MKICMVVADQTEAILYDALAYARPPAVAARLTNPAERLHERDLVADRPGRMFRFTGHAQRRRGASPRYAVGREPLARLRASRDFARAIAALVDRRLAAREFDRLVLIAPPAFLGQLRAALSPRVRQRIADTVHKDIVHRAPLDACRYLRREMFATLPFTAA